jgi:transposase
MDEADAPLLDDLATCHELIRQQADTIREAKRRIEQLEHLVAQLLRRQYGPRSERLDPNQLRLFDDDAAQASAEPQPAEAMPEDRRTPARTWRRCGRRALPEHLPRERITLELSEQERACPGFGRLRLPFGEEVSEQLESMPAALFVRQFVRRKYACRSCREHVAIAAKPPQTTDKGLPGPGLLAHVITSKYSEHLPLYRQEDVLARHGVTLSRATLCGWMARAAELLKPLYDLMAERVRSSKVIWTDDTPVPVWDPTLPETRTGRFWVYVGDRRNPYTIYAFTPRRTRDGPERFLAGFRGYLQADAFTGYDRLCASPDVIRVTCWAHARRKFHDARTSAPLLAHETLARIRQLYRIEDASKGLDADERGAIRQRGAVPLLDSFGEWLTEQSRQVLPKSPIGQAISYSQAQWEDLRTYTRVGDLSIDNNPAERRLHPQAIGRKNFLFVGSDRGGRTAAILYSLVGSCKRHQVDPFAYLKDVLARLPTHPVDRLAELLPDDWFAAHPYARCELAS